MARRTQRRRTQRRRTRRQRVSNQALYREKEGGFLFFKSKNTQEAYLAKKAIFVGIAERLVDAMFTSRQAFINAYIESIDFLVDNEDFAKSKFMEEGIKSDIIQMIHVAAEVDTLPDKTTRGAKKLQKYFKVDE